MNPTDRLFGELALRHSVLTREQLAELARQLVDERSGKSLAELAVAHGFLTESDMRLLVKRRDEIVKADAARRAQPSPRAPDQTAPVDRAPKGPGGPVIRAATALEIDDPGAIDAAPARPSLPPRPSIP